MRISDWSSDVCSRSISCGIVQFRAGVGLPNSSIAGDEKGFGLLIMLVLDFANDFFHQILNGDQAFRARIFVKHNGQMGSFGPHFREKIKHAHGFGRIEWLPDKHSEIGGGWLTPSQYRESIANMYHYDFGIEEDRQSQRLT